MELNEFSIENWCIELDKEWKGEQLSKENAKILINLVLNKDSIDRQDILSELVPRYQSISIMYNRIKDVHTYTVTNTALIFMQMLVRNPGECVMLVNYLQYLSKKYNKSRFMLGDLVEIFPMGGWSEEVMHKFWSMQKLRPEDRNGGTSDNMLDYPFIYGKSLGLVRLG